jgi:hypothetical protein
MWLLDSKTLELKLYYDNAIPHYAILSHVWGENEISFQQNNGSRTEIESHAGYIKIQKCCAQAAMDGFEHAWIDTCCIDKTNSAELSEAINSMFKWYRNATECYIYLADITSVDDLWKSRWFTRGWTLQELLAPASAIFFNKDWIEIGTKASLAEKISLVTKIPIRVLLGRKSEGDQELSLAQVMSWAANRETTRVEDVGYSLLGIFGVNMPMIYGEGDKAFLRLQHEIIKVSTDQSLFAWGRSSNRDYQRQMLGDDRSAFARSPADFAACGNVVQSTFKDISEFSLTNKGLRIEVPLDPLQKVRRYVAYLNCKEQDPSKAEFSQLGIQLRQISDDQYVRVAGSTVFVPSSVKKKKKCTIYITEPGASFGFSMGTDSFPKRKIMFSPSYNQCLENGFLLAGQVAYKDANELDIYCFRSQSPEQFAASALYFMHESKPNVRFIVVFGVIDYRVWIDIEISSDNELLGDIAKSYFSKYGRDEHLLHPKRWQARDSWRDRVTVSLQDGSSANVALERGLVSGIESYLVHVTVT